MPFRLTNSPAVFMTLMNSVFASHLDKFVVVFIDYILIYSQLQGEHEKHLWISLQIIRHNKLYATKECVPVDPTKIEVVLNWERTTSVTEIRSFSELVGYYKKLVEGFSSIATSLTKLAWKCVLFHWSDECEECFQELKLCLNGKGLIVLQRF